MKTPRDLKNLPEMFSNIADAAQQGNVDWLWEMFDFLDICLLDEEEKTSVKAVIETFVQLLEE